CNCNCCCNCRCNSRRKLCHHRWSFCKKRKYHKSKFKIRNKRSRKKLQENGQSNFSEFVVICHCKRATIHEKNFVIASNVLCERGNPLCHHFYFVIPHAVLSSRTCCGMEDRRSCPRIPQ